MLDPLGAEEEDVDDETDIEGDEDLKKGAEIDSVIRVVWTADEVGVSITGVPVSVTIPEMLAREVEGTGMLDGSADDIEGAALVNPVADRRFVDVIVMVIVPAVPAIASGIPEQMVYTLPSSTASLLGQSESRH